MNIPENCIVLDVRMSLLHVRRKADPSRIESKADRALMVYGKKILDSEELRDIEHIDGDTRRTIEALAVPGNLLRGGMYVLPVALVERVRDFLVAQSAKRDVAVDAFLAAYETRRKEAEARLRDQYNGDDYESEERVRNKFRFTWTFKSFGTPETLKALNESIFAEERKKAEEQWVEATASIQAALREGFEGLVTHLVERLTPDPDGKRKVLKGSVVQNLKDFLEVFDARNVTDDTALRKVIDRAKALVDGVDPVAFKDEAFRDRMRAKFATVQTEAVRLVTKAARRAAL